MDFVEYICNGGHVKTRSGQHITVINIEDKPSGIGCIRGALPDSTLQWHWDRDGTFTNSNKGNDYEMICIHDPKYNSVIKALQRHGLNKEADVFINKR